MARGHGVEPSAVVILAVAFLSVLAGCSAGLPGDTGTPTGRTVTPAPVPTDGPTDLPLPPGISAEGVTDAERLEAGHAAALTNRTFVERARTTVRFENGSLAIEETYLGRHGPNATRVSFRRTGAVRYGVPDRSLVEAGVWGNASFGVRRFVTAHDRVELGAFEGTGLFYRRPRGGYGLALREAETALGARRVANGTVEYVVVVAEGLDPRGPWYFRRTFMRLRGDGHARVVVTPDGTIRRFAVEFPVTIAGRSATLRHIYTVERGEVTVPRPPWFEDAIAGRTPGPLALSPGDGPLALPLDGQSGPSAPGATRTRSGDPVGA